jgi:hypothetical protein
MRLLFAPAANLRRPMQIITLHDITMALTGRRINRERWLHAATAWPTGGV